MNGQPAGPRPLDVVTIDDPRWLALVDSDPNATPFHHPAWARLLERCYGYPSFLLAENGPDGTIRAGLPVVEVSNPLRRRRWISVAYADDCPPLGSFGEPAEMGRRLTEVTAQAGVSSLEVRAPIDGQDVHRREDWVGHVLPLGDDADALFQGFDGKTRRNVRHAEKSGLEVRRGEGAAALTESFYRLHVDTRRRLGVPVQPLRFFRLLWEELLEPGLGFVLLAYAGARPVAAGVFLSWNGNLIYKFGASDYQARHATPNNLLLWHAIRWGVENGHRRLDFGRSEPDQAGLIAFKGGWGARQEPLIYSYVAQKPPRAEAQRKAALLAPVVRRSPRWVSRLLGELFYRYAA
jgi:hypothetical protein